MQATRVKGKARRIPRTILSDSAHAGHLAAMDDAVRGLPYRNGCELPAWSFAARRRSAARAGPCGGNRWPDSCSARERRSRNPGSAQPKRHGTQAAPERWPGSIRARRHPAALARHPSGFRTWPGPSNARPALAPCKGSQRKTPPIHTDTDSPPPPHTHTHCAKHGLTSNVFASHRLTAGTHKPNTTTAGHACSPIHQAHP